MTKQELLYRIGLSNSDYEDHFFSSLKKTIYDWSYYVDWGKVDRHVDLIKVELSILNSLIGSNNFDAEFKNVLGQYPAIVRAFPVLLAIRHSNLSVFIENSKIEEYQFGNRELLTNKDIESYVEMMQESGLKDLFTNSKIKNLVDYIYGVEVGLDSNARKNRGGTKMENLVKQKLEASISTSAKIFSILEQATKNTIQNSWDLSVSMDKTNRRIDFAVKREDDEQLFFIEVNYYNSSGSKLKATAKEYQEMSTFWRNQGIHFIWITDGQGWNSTVAAIKEYLDSNALLINLDGVDKGYLLKVLTEAVKLSCS